MAVTVFTRRTLIAGLAAAPFVRGSAQATGRRTGARDGALSRRRRRTTGRIVFGKLGEALNQQFVVENRGGAGGPSARRWSPRRSPTATPAARRHGFLVNFALFEPAVRLQQGLRPGCARVAGAEHPRVTPSVPVKTVADVIAYAKAAPDGIDMASSGNGTLQHLSLEMFRHDTGIKISHVPYRGGGLALNEVMAGQVKFFFANGSAGSADQGWQGEGDRAYRQGPAHSLPDIPPVSDTLPGFEAYEWNGVFVPHGTPAPIVQKLNGGINTYCAMRLSAAFPAAQHRHTRIPRRKNSQLRAGADDVVEQGGEGRQYPPGLTSCMRRAAAHRRPGDASAQAARAAAARRLGRARAHFRARRQISFAGPRLHAAGRAGRALRPLLDHLGFAHGLLVQGNAHGYDNRVCSTRWRAIRSGCAASPSPTRALRRRLARLARARHARLALRSVFGDRKARYVRGVGLECSRCSARRCAPRLGHAVLLRLAAHERLRHDIARYFTRDAGDRRSYAAVFPAYAA